MISLAALEEVLLLSAPIQKWPIDPEHASLAVCALEEEGKKTEIHLFTTFSLEVEEVNRVLRDHGISNLARFRAVHVLSSIPLLGSGKIDYRQLRLQLENYKT